MTHISYRLAATGLQARSPSNFVDFIFIDNRFILTTKFIRIWNVLSCPFSDIHIYFRFEVRLRFGFPISTYASDILGYCPIELTVFENMVYGIEISIYRVYRQFQFLGHLHYWIAHWREYTHDALPRQYITACTAALCSVKDGFSSKGKTLIFDCSPDSYLVTDQHQIWHNY